MQKTMIIDGISYIREDSIKIDEDFSFSQEIEKLCRPFVYASKFLKQGEESMMKRIEHVFAIRQFVQKLHLAKTVHPLFLLHSSIVKESKFKSFAKEYPTPELQKVLEELEYLKKEFIEKEKRRDSKQEANSYYLMYSAIFGTCCLKPSNEIERFMKDTCSAELYLKDREKLNKVSEKLLELSEPFITRVSLYLKEEVYAFYKDYVCFEHIKPVSFEEWVGDFSFKTSLWTNEEQGYINKNSPFRHLL